MPTATFTVVGMTCGHCVASIKREVGAIPGVTDIEVQLGTGVVTIESDSPISDDSVLEAVESAGYELEAPTPITRLNLLGGNLLDSGGDCCSGR